MLFATAGAVAWVKLFDYFARHELIERVKGPTCSDIMHSCHVYMHMRLHGSTAGLRT